MCHAKEQLVVGQCKGRHLMPGHVMQSTEQQLQVSPVGLQAGPSLLSIHLSLLLKLIEASVLRYGLP